MLLLAVLLKEGRRLFEIMISAGEVDLGIKFSCDIPCELILPGPFANLSSFDVRFLEQLFLMEFSLKIVIKTISSYANGVCDRDLVSSVRKS